MKFIDLRGQYYADEDLPRAEQKLIFAFLCDSTDRFLSFGDKHIWESVGEFVEDFKLDKGDDLPRYLGLIPDDFKTPEDHQLEADERERSRIGVAIAEEKFSTMLINLNIYSRSEVSAVFEVMFIFSNEFEISH